MTGDLIYQQQRDRLAAQCRALEAVVRDQNKLLDECQRQVAQLIAQGRRLQAHIDQAEALCRDWDVAYARLADQHKGLPAELEQVQNDRCAAWQMAEMFKRRNAELAEQNTELRQRVMGRRPEKG